MSSLKETNSTNNININNDTFNILKLRNISITSDIYQFSFLPLSLLEIVQSYLQYKEALLVYNFFNTSIPERPIIHLDKPILLYDLKETKIDYLATGHEFWYIEHKDSFSLKEEDVHNIHYLQKYYSFYWQCPLCLKYTLIETINCLEKEIRIRTTIFEYWLSILEDCRGDNSSLHRWCAEHCRNMGDSITWLEMKLQSSKANCA